MDRQDELNPVLTSAWRDSSMMPGPHPDPFPKPGRASHVPGEQDSLPGDRKTVFPFKKKTKNIANKGGTQNPPFP